VKDELFLTTPSVARAMTVLYVTPEATLLRIVRSYWLAVLQRYWKPWNIVGGSFVAPVLQCHYGPSDPLSLLNNLLLPRGHPQDHNGEVTYYIYF